MIVVTLGKYSGFTICQLPIFPLKSESEEYESMLHLKCLHTILPYTQRIHLLPSNTCWSLLKLILLINSRIISTPGDRLLKIYSLVLGIVPLLPLQHII